MLLNMNSKNATKLLGLKKYRDTYGRMSEAVHLTESHEEIDDWHLRVPFEREEVKMLCCPEDVACLRSDMPAHPET